MLRIGVFAEITGVTPRLLRHYEAVKVFAPAVTDRRTGYRYYTREQIAELQQLLAYRAAGMPLSVVSKVVNEPGSRDSVYTALIGQRAALLEERQKLDRQLEMLEEEIAGHATTIPNRRPFRIKRTGPTWVVSLRRTVETYADAEALLQELRTQLSPRDETTLATIWHCCRPAERSIDCEVQVLFARPPARSRLPVDHLPSQLVVSLPHTGSDTELPAIYKEMTRWSNATRYQHCGPLREVYWDTGDELPITEVQFPVRRS